MELKVNLVPESVTILGAKIGLSVVTGWIITAALVLLLVVNYFLVIRRMKPTPRGLQSLWELAVESAHKWTSGKVGKTCADFVAPVVMTLMTYVFFTTIVELFGFEPATSDINCTFAMGLCTFLLVNVTGLKYRGVRGRLRGLATPSAVVFPIRVLTDFIAPCSIAIRLFANVMVGGIIMQLIYAVVPIVLPAIISSYFNVLHVLIQTFVLGLLSLVYVSEAMGEEE